MKSLLHQCGFCKDAKRKLGRAFICTSLCLLNFFYVNAQSEKVSVSVKNGTIKELFKTIEKQTTYRFSYRSSEVETGKRITVEATKESLIVPLIFFFVFPFGSIGIITIVLFSTT